MPDELQGLGTGDEEARYSRRSLERSEYLYGRGFQSPGGEASVREFASELPVPQGARALDLGCGVGGAAVYLSRELGLEVAGIDASPDCVQVARERVRAADARGVSFELADAVQMPFPHDHFDLVWSRDTIVCIPDEKRLFAEVRRVLRPGGRLFLTDFCRSAGPVSDAFRRYADACGYYLMDLDAYAALLRATGFHDVETRDITSRLLDWLRTERTALEARREEFMDRFGREDYDWMVERWSTKVRFCEAGDLVWGRVDART